MAIISVFSKVNKTIKDGDVCRTVPVSLLETRQADDNGVSNDVQNEYLRRQFKLAIISYIPMGILLSLVNALFTKN